LIIYIFDHRDVYNLIWLPTVLCLTLFTLVHKNVHSVRIISILLRSFEAFYGPSYILFPIVHIGSVRFAKKTSQNTVPADLLWEKKNTVPAEKQAKKVRIIRRSACTQHGLDPIWQMHALIIYYSPNKIQTQTNHSIFIFHSRHRIICIPLFNLNI